MLVNFAVSGEEASCLGVSRGGFEFLKAGGYQAEAASFLPMRECHSSAVVVVVVFACFGSRTVVRT